MVGKVIMVVCFGLWDGWINGYDELEYKLIILLPTFVPS
jgi:hypothetical protein